MVGRPRMFVAIAGRITLISIVSGVLTAVGCSGGERAREPSLEVRSRSSAEDEAPSRPDDAPPSRRDDAPFVVLEPPGHGPAVVRVEVARTPAQTQRGLMYRRELDRDAGMLFLFPRARHQTFWMRNTHLPLDMIFITSEMRVLGVVENATPETDDPRQVDGVSQFVLEVNAGFAREHGIGPGTLVRFENVPEYREEEAWED